jgi:uncharacterized protein
MKKTVLVYFIASGKYHDIDFARLEVLRLLAEHDHIRTTVAHDYSDIAAITASDMLVTYTCDVMPTANQTEALRRFVGSGKRWFALHGTNSILKFLDNGLVGTPEDNAPFMELLGTQFKAHPPIGPMKVTVVDKTHALTRGMDDFEIVDELYLSKTTAPIHVLMKTSFDGEATGFEDLHWKEDTVPILYLRDFESGSVLYITLGHCRGHYDLASIGVPFYPNPERCAWNYPIYYELLRRGFRWALKEL